MGHSVTDDLILVVREHRHEPTTGGPALGARTGRRVLPGARQGGAASSVLVAPSLLLTSRREAASAERARGRAVSVDMPIRAAGYRVRLDPDHAFITSPALGWTLVGVEQRGLPTLALRHLTGLVLPAAGDGALIAGAGRWVDGARIRADLRRRLRVLGGAGDAIRRTLGL